MHIVRGSLFVNCDWLAPNGLFRIRVCPPAFREHPK